MINFMALLVVKSPQNARAGGRPQHKPGFLL